MRPCFLCGKSFARLSRHIKKKHKDDHRVAKALEKPLKERNKIFQTFKKEGIRLENLKRIGEDAPNFLRERKIRKCKNIVMCSACQGFLLKLITVVTCASVEMIRVKREFQYLLKTF